jgi:hypothetical protein
MWEVKKPCDKLTWWYQMNAHENMGPTHLRKEGQSCISYDNDLSI